MKNYLYYSRREDLLEIAIVDFESWEDFDSIIYFLKQNYPVNIVKELDGPGVRRWVLESNGHPFELIHDDNYANYFKAPNKDSEKIIISITKEIEQRLAKGGTI